MDVSVAALLAAVALAAVHLEAWRLRLADRVPRSRWLSFAGGISVAYVFVHLLPELAEAQATVEEAAGEGVAFLERHVYLLALAGLALFYGVERAARRSRAQRRERGHPDATGASAFVLSIASFAVYNVVVGYALAARAEEGAEELVLFAAAMAVHFVVNDVGLSDHHRDAYRRSGRWILGGAPILGWALGVAVAASDAWFALVLAFVAGGVVLNVLKEELPEERASRFGAFLLGAVAYSALLVAV